MIYNKETNKIFQDKDLRIAKLSVATNRMNIIAALIKAKPELVIEDILKIANQIMAENYQDQTLEDALGWIYQGMPSKIEEMLATPLPITYEQTAKEKKIRFQELTKKIRHTDEEQQEFLRLEKELKIEKSPF